MVVRASPAPGRGFFLWYLRKRKKQKQSRDKDVEVRAEVCDRERWIGVGKPQTGMDAGRDVVHENGRSRGRLLAELLTLHGPDAWLHRVFVIVRFPLW